MQRWRADYFISKVDHLVNISRPAACLKHCHPAQKVVPLFRESLPYAGLSYLSVARPSYKEEVSVRKLWEIIEEGSEVLYSSGNIELYPSLESELPDLSWFVMDPSEPPVVMLWMGSKGVTAPTHYDKSHNFFIQINGTKRFILSPPEEHNKLYLYPSLHPMRLQSQVDFWNVNRTKFNHFEEVLAYDVLLHPGDVLYLPPYWFHRVITEEPGIGLNIWSTSLPMKIEKNYKNLPLPVSPTWSKEQIRVGLYMFFHSLLMDILKHELAAQFFVQKMIDLQFTPVFGDIHIEVLICGFEGQYSFSKQSKEAIQQSAQIVAQQFSGIDNPYILELELFTYIEKATSVVLGAELVYPFLRDCLYPFNLLQTQ
uniref:JmjC domain-containing protein n=1 Tax=Arcella intermedia TaxID=1963864 RepID=A0A6B2L6L0_9EUKA